MMHTVITAAAAAVDAVAAAAATCTGSALTAAGTAKVYVVQVAAFGLGWRIIEMCTQNVSIFPHGSHEKI
jgi:hypothetical protein